MAMNLRANTKKPSSLCKLNSRLATFQYESSFLPYIKHILYYTTLLSSSIERIHMGTSKRIVMATRKTTCCIKSQINYTRSRRRSSLSLGCIKNCSSSMHCKPGPDLNSHLTQGGRKWLNSVKYASPGAHLSQEKQRNRKVRMSLM
jgi:hypothetical protein